MKNLYKANIKNLGGKKEIRKTSENGDSWVIWKTGKLGTAWKIIFIVIYGKKGKLEY